MAAPANARGVVVPYIPPEPVDPAPVSTKEQHYLLDEVGEKITDLESEETYEFKKYRLFYWCTLSGAAGTLLVMYALGLTVLFASTKPKGIAANVALGIGVVFMSPCLCWFKYVFIPTKEQYAARKLMHAKRRERVDEQARVVKEKLRLAKIDDDKKALAKQKLNQELEDGNYKRSTRNSSVRGY